MLEQIRVQAIELVVRTARKISDHPASVLKRPKSQAYLFGTLRRRFAEADEETIRTASAKIKPSDLPDVEIDRRPRPPTKGRELLGDELPWAPRIARLFWLVVDPTTTKELLWLAQRVWGWDKNLTIQVIAAAESEAAIVFRGTRWHPGRVSEQERRVVIKEQRTRTVRAKQSLPVKLKAGEITEAVRQCQNHKKAAAEIEEEIRITLAHLKNRLKVHEAQAEHFELMITNGSELRVVDVEEIHNLDSGKVRVRRLDTNQVVYDREMTDKERQPSLFDEAPPALPSAAIA